VKLLKLKTPNTSNIGNKIIVPTKIFLTILASMSVTVLSLIYWKDIMTTADINIDISIISEKLVLDVLNENNDSRIEWE